ncbi:PepSY domain-containing protein [Brevibacterium permense]|uniref:PepSY-associated TM helix domain-containing protein n=1 Tax=Brevibacterium permense TaxID=234834 RepID=UPI0021CFEE2D|nr:PepSY-associated TM helix domain-containing protein [Brevibacterium permense]MCU4298631.1 PepSY domain-containing protein [Brevibacterium permense]
MTTPSSTVPENSDSNTRPLRPRRGRPWLGQLLRRLHFYAGILIGPFILIAALTGAAYAISPTVERAIYADELSVPATDHPLPLADQIEAANTVIKDSDATLSAVRPAPEPGDTTRVMYDDPSLGESESRAIFVDPGTAEVVGDLTVYGTSGALPLRTWIDQMHRSLHLGDVGRLYSELAASWLGIVAAAGLVLWILRARRTRKPTAMLRPSRKGKGLRRTFSWHASVGVWAVIGMLFLSATGITWSQLGGENVTKLRAALSWETPAVSTELGGASATDEHAHHHGDSSAAEEADSAADHAAIDPADFDMVLSMGHDVNIDTGLVEILPPADADSAWVVQEIQRSFPTKVDAVAFDPETMEVTDRVDFSDYGAAAKLARWGIDLHMGTLFGLVNQIVLCVLALGIAAMVVWGYVMWWQRRPRRNPAKKFGFAPSRGALADAPLWGVGAVVLAAVAIGLFLPLVGISLIVFLILDVLLGLRTQRRERRAMAS